MAGTVPAEFLPGTALEMVPHCRPGAALRVRILCSFDNLRVYAKFPFIRKFPVRRVWC